jgi:hypothetical protein
MVLGKGIKPLSPRREPVYSRPRNSITLSLTLCATGRIRTYSPLWGTDLQSAATLQLRRCGILHFLKELPSEVRNYANLRFSRYLRKPNRPLSPGLRFHRRELL